MDILQPQSKLNKTNPLSHKLQKLLSISLENEQTKEAFKELSTFYTDNTAVARRNLMNNIEQQEMLINNTFLNSLKKVNDEVVLLEKELNSMNSMFNEMANELTDKKNNMKHIIQQTNILNKQKTQLELKKNISETFLSKFTLTEEEINCLTVRGPLERSFFEAMTHLQKIINDCQILLISNNQTAGLEIMDKMSGYQEKAFENLFHWAQAETRIMTKENPEITSLFRDALVVLRQRQVLFQLCMDEIAQIRKEAIVKSFIDALTVGGPEGIPRPIEFFAHDPLRYVGDMLAWIHQTLASEREMLQGLFDVRGKKMENGEPVTSTADQEYYDDMEKIFTIVPDNKTIIELLNKILEGTCRPLQVRIEQIFKSSNLGVVEIYRIYSLLQFYHNTIENVLGSEAFINVSLQKLIEKALEIFYNNLRIQGEQLLEYSEPISNDLQPSSILKEGIMQLKDIMASYDTSLVSNNDKEAGFSEILSLLIDPIMQFVGLSSTNLNKYDSAIYMINSLTLLQNTLNQYSFTKKSAEKLNVEIGVYIDILIHEEYINILNQSGIESIIHAAQTAIRENKPPQSLQAMQIKNINESMKKFDEFLCSVNLDLSRNLMTLSQTELAVEIGQKGIIQFIQNYEELYNYLMDSANGYVNTSSEGETLINLHTVQELKTLLCLNTDTI